MTDITVETPATVKEAIELYATLAAAEWPYLRIFRALEDHTQWKKQSRRLRERGGQTASSTSASSMKVLRARRRACARTST